MDLAYTARVADWKTRQHLEDHYELHRREFPGLTLEQYDASAQETIATGTRFTYRARRSYEPRIGYFHRETSRFVATDLDGFIRSHHRTDESEVAEQIDSTYRD